MANAAAEAFYATRLINADIVRESIAEWRHERVDNHKRLMEVVRRASHTARFPI